MAEEREPMSAHEAHALLATQIGAKVLEGIYVKGWDRVLVSRTKTGDEVTFDFEEITRTVPEGGYTVELGGQTFTQAQWEAVQTYVAGRLADPGPTETEGPVTP